MDTKIRRQRKTIRFLSKKKIDKIRNKKGLEFSSLEVYFPGKIGFLFFPALPVLASKEVCFVLDLSGEEFT
ncbi:myosin-binding protein 7-like isoform X2 [Gossypium australe]|uniref:Myosin-binding protein 7-like isoform X2 n=1 Tax=Gossypium australe TaxID=47621 RepID=A0A5B6VC95_9ROSI|nr:myosin-binding protein 7-like isoform X2 [Gossypium australe]